MARTSRWLIFAPVAALAWVAPASADVVTGLAVTGYSIDEIPPVMSDDQYPVCGQGTLDFINATWDTPEQQFGECGTDLFMLHYTGAIQIPEHDTIEFWLASDDGGMVTIGTHQFGSWVDQGCSATESGLLDIDAGVQSLDAWVYENGGGTCFMLAWNIDGQGWAIVQPESFTSEPIPDTTVPDTTVPDTTVPDTTMPDTTVPDTTTSSTTTSSTTTSSTTTSSTIYVTTSQIPVTTSSTTTSTTTTAAPVPTQTSTTTTEPPAVPSTTTTETPIETSTTWPPTTAPETTVPVISTTSSFAPSTTAVATTTTTPVIETTVPAVDTTVETTPVTETTVDLIQELSDLSNAVAGLADVLPDQITVADIAAITDSAAFEMLTDEQVAEIGDIISDASDDVKESFESAVDIFASDALSSYVPAGSTISVGQRRAVIAVTALTFVLPVPISSGSQSQSQRKR